MHEEAENTFSKYKAWTKKKKKKKKNIVCKFTYSL